MGVPVTLRDTSKQLWANTGSENKHGTSHPWTHTVHTHTYTLQDAWVWSQPQTWTALERKSIKNPFFPPSSEITACQLIQQACSHPLTVNHRLLTSAVHAAHKHAKTPQWFSKSKGWCSIEMLTAAATQLKFQLLTALKMKIHGRTEHFAQGAGADTRHRTV